MNTRSAKNLATLDKKAQAIFKPFIEAAEALAATLGCEYIAINGNRTFAEQDKLFAKGRTIPPIGKAHIVTNARGGQSNHNFAIALDFGVFKGTRYLDDGTKAEKSVASGVHRSVAEKLAKKHGIDWGGNWKSIKDEPHFEIATGLTLEQKRDRMKKNGSVL
jgi:peptidoglycan L-alanyl-D-glutamate endopeptidase CwlK